MMDKIEFNQNVFLEIKDANSDLTILPFEVNWEFLASLRQSFKMMYGATWEMKAEFLSNTVTVKECQHVKREHSTDWDPSKDVLTSDEDYEELDDDED